MSCCFKKKAVLVALIALGATAFAQPAHLLLHLAELGKTLLVRALDEIGRHEAWQSLLGDVHIAEAVRLMAELAHPDETTARRTSQHSSARPRRSRRSTIRTSARSTTSAAKVRRTTWSWR